MAEDSAEDRVTLKVRFGVRPRAATQFQSPPRLVDKLEHDGLLTRKSCPSDGRAIHAQLTDKGVNALRKMWPTYRDGIATHFSSRLSASELATLTALLGRLSAEPAGAKSDKTQ